MEPGNVSPFTAAKHRFRLAETTRALEEYENLIDRAAKITKFSYFTTHKRIERVFDGEKAEAVLHWLRYAVNRSEAETEWPQGKRFNYELKKIKESRAAATTKQKMPSLSEEDTRP